MTGLVILLVLLVLLFGALGIFVAKAFLLALAVVLIAGLLTGGLAFRDPV